MLAIAPMKQQDPDWPMSKSSPSTDQNQINQNQTNQNESRASARVRIEPRKLKGFRDYLPSSMRIRQMILKEIRNVARSAAFQEISTPALEYAETLLGQGSDETDKQVYRFEDHGGRKVAMRFDLTVPFARFIAEHQGELVFPFKKLQTGQVWRGENTQKGRYREFGQCDLDIIGVDSVAADVEVMLALATVLSRLPCGSVTMAINHRGLLSGILSAAYGEGFSSDEEVKALIAIDKLDKAGAAEVKRLLAQISARGRSSEEAAEFVLTAIGAMAGGTGKTADLQHLRNVMMAKNPAALAALEPVMDRVAATLALLNRAKPGDNVRFELNLSIARGLGYYTGVVFETTLDRLPGFGSVSSGGRYNDLVSRFSNRQFAGVGGSIGLDRLVAGIEELGLVESGGAEGVMVVVASPDALEYAFDVAQMLRADGFCTDLGLTEGKVGNQFKFASRQRYVWAVTVGGSEMAQRTANVKNLETGVEARDIPLGEVLTRLRTPG